MLGGEDAVPDDGTHGMAAAGSFNELALLCGISPMQMFQVIDDLSTVLHTKDARRRDGGEGTTPTAAGAKRRKASETPGPRKRKGWADVQADETRSRRWRQSFDLWEKIEHVAGGPKSLAGMVIEGLANTAIPRGHGARAARKLGTKDAIISALVNERDGAFKTWLVNTLRAADKPDDLVHDHLQSKRKGKMSYAALDCYRHLFYQKAPSRGKMNREMKLLLALIETSLVASGPTWLSGQEWDAWSAEEAEARREEAAAAALADAEGGHVAADARVLYRAFVKAEVARLKERDIAAGESVAPRAMFKEAAVAWRTSDQNPRVQQDQRAAAEAEARLVKDSLTWGAPGLALITEHRKHLFMQEFVGAGALEGGRTGAGTEQVRWMEDYYEGRRFDEWHGHVFKGNTPGTKFWLERLPGKVISDAAKMIPERHISDEELGEHSEWKYFSINREDLREKFKQLNMGNRAFGRRRVVTYNSLYGPEGLKETDPEAFARVEHLVKSVHSEGGPGHTCDVGDILCDDMDDPAEAQTRVFLFYFEPDFPAPDPTEGEDLEPEVEDESGRGSKPPEPSWGAKDVREVLNWLLMCRLRGWVVLADSKASYLGLQASLDAASVRKAQKGKKHWTTVILKVLCAGVRDGKWGMDAVVHQLEDAHSPHKFAKVRVWNGKDDWANFEAHVKPMIEQLLKLCSLGAYTVPKMIMPLPPLIIRLWGEVEEPVAETYRWPAAESTPKKQKKRQRRQQPSGDEDEDEDEGRDEPEQVQAMLTKLPTGDPAEREACVRGAAFNLSLNMGGDGGFLSSGAGHGATIASDRPSLLDDLTRAERQLPLSWQWLDAGDDVRKWCERNEPGDKGIVAAALMGLDSRVQPALAKLTREPLTRTRLEPAAPRRPARRGWCAGDDSAQRDRSAREQQNAAALANSAGAGVALEWDDDRLNDIGFDPETWVQKVSSAGGEEGQRYGIDTPLTEATLLRLPIMVPVGKRHLAKAAWGELPLLERICLCILHAGMRTCEALVKLACDVRPPKSAPEPPPWTCPPRPSLVPSLARPWPAVG